jgi:hypothetical protein
MLERLITLAQAYRFKQLSSELLLADRRTQDLCRSLGFRLETIPEDGIVRVSYAL